MSTVYQRIAEAVGRGGGNEALNEFYRVRGGIGAVGMSIAGKLLQSEMLQQDNRWLATEFTNMELDQDVHLVPVQIEVEMVDDPEKIIEIEF